MEISKVDIEECQRALTFMHEIVTEFGPDYVYTKIERDSEDIPMCYYVDNGECSCIVGRVLFKMGWTIDELIAIEGKTPLSFKFPINKLSELTKEVLARAQSYQDSGYSWGRCANAALVTFKTLTER